MPKSVAKRRAGTPKGREKHAQDVIDFIEEHCFIPEGRLVGQKVKLLPWQKAIIRDIYDNPAGTRRAIVSFGRKNAKTTLSAFLLLAHLCGPVSKQNSSLYSAAQSRDQAGILFGLAAKIVRMSPELRANVIVRDTAKELVCRDRGTIYKALSAEASTAYGLSPALIVHDELGQVQGPRSKLYDALETATAAQEQPLSIIISTQAPTDADLLSVLIDDAKAGHDPRVVLSLYTADPLLDPFSDKAIKQANPAFGKFLNADEVRAMAEDARRMPSRESEYRNLVLNQRVQAYSPFVSRLQWEACAGPVADLHGIPVYGGLDLAAVSDLTAFVLMGRIDGIWHVRPTFWLPRDGLEEKSRKDRVPYDLWVKQGLLLTTPGRSVDYEHVAEYLRGVFDNYDVQKVGFDRWSMNQLRPRLLAAGFSEALVDTAFLDFGQGTKSMTPALRELESIIRNERLAHGGHPVLGMCAANAVVEGVEDARKLSKAKSNGRIDGMVALADAFGVAPSDKEPVLDVSAMIA